MTPPDDELLEVLTELRKALPTMRFGQLICNLGAVARGATQGATWDMEDDELLVAARHLLESRTAVSRDA